MKKFILTMLVAAMATSAWSVVPRVYFSSDAPKCVKSGEEYAILTIPDRFKPVPGSRAESGVTYTVNFDMDNGNFTTFAAQLCNEEKDYMQFVQEDKAVFENVVPGKYYLILNYSNAGKPEFPRFAVVVKEVNVTDGATITTSPLEADKVIKFRSLMPDGKEPVLPVTEKKHGEGVGDDDLDWTGATASEVAAYTAVNYKRLGTLVMASSNLLYTNTEKTDVMTSLDIAVNDCGDNWSFAQTRYIVDREDNQYFTSLGATGTTVEPVVNKPEYVKWEYKFAENPIQQEFGDDGWPYGVMPVTVINGEVEPGYITTAKGLIPKIYMSAPVVCSNPEFVNDYAVCMERTEVNIEKQTDWGVDIDMRSIESPYVIWDKETKGLKFCVLGAPQYGSNLWWNEDEIKPLVPGNQSFVSQVDNLRQPLGKSAPVAVTTLEIEDYGDYTNIELEPFYLGQYGEGRCADSAMSTAFITTPDGKETTVELDDLKKTMRDMSEEGKFNGPFSIEIANDRNIDIDWIQGKNITTLKYTNPANGDIYGPTATMMQFRNTTGEVSNIFEKAADGKLLLSGGDLSYDGTDWSCSPVTLKVEYATENSEDFKEIVMEEVPDGFVMPTFGYLWQGSLKDVEGTAFKGWYQLRISMTDADGNSQVQTIYPAFCVKEFAGINAVDAAGADAPVEYYSLQGIRLDNPVPGNVVIRRQGTEVAKIIVR